MTAEIADLDPRFEVPIYHLHGAVFGTDKPHIVITRQDYAQFTERRKILFGDTAGTIRHFDVLIHRVFE